MRKRNLLVTALAATLLSGCAEGSASPEASASSAIVAEETTVEGASVEPSATAQSTEKQDETAELETTAAVSYEDALGDSMKEVGSWSTIKLKDNCSTSSDNTVKISDGNKITIKEAGYYEIYGELTDGQISVKTDESSTVVIKLNGVTINNKEKSPIKVKSAGKVIIYLAEGSENSLTCGVKGQTSPASEEEDTARNAINSDYPISICGPGNLNIYGYAKKGIHSNSTVTITGGNINVVSLTDGIKGDEGVAVSGGNIDIDSGNNAIKADKGDVTVTGGRINVTKSYEGIEADNVYIEDGFVNIVSADDGINANNEDCSSEKNGVIINGGAISISSEGDGIDSNSYLIINGGYVVVDGPTNSKNSPLDSGEENGGLLLVNGGTVIAWGAKGGIKEFDASSKQAYIIKNISFSAGDTINLGVAAKYTVNPTKSGDGIVFSCSGLTEDVDISVLSK